jgi:alkaline phosphatase
MYEEIAADYLDLEVDYLVGGGKKFFDRRTVDERNLVQEFQDKGFVVQSYLDDELYNIRIPEKQNFIYFTADSEPLAHMAGRTYFPIACLKGIEYLEQKSDKGFFFLIESSQIDWGGHANEDKIIIDEIIEFDEVIGDILDYARQDGETLVVVTADHETGGFAINGEKNRRELSIAFTTKSHTATMVPLFAYGPGSDLFRGIYDNTEIYRKLKALMQF